MPNPRRVYRTRLFDSGDHRAWAPPYRGRFWQGDLRFLEVEEAAYYLVTPEVIGGKKQFAPEIMIHASDRPTGQRAANLILAAASVAEGFQLLEELIALPEPGEPLEDLEELKYESAINSAMLTRGLAKASAIAAKASLRRHWTKALVCHFASLRAISVSPMDTHDPHSGITFRVERDPLNHAFFAQAIISGYMAIEAMGLEIRASRMNPSKLSNGEWNLSVLRDLENRLTSAGIDLDEKFVWFTRNSPTRIERKYGTPKGTVLRWASGPNRDRLISVTDAISRASLIRSKAAAHGGLQLIQSVTVYDVHNIQRLARRLLLESLGFWRRY